MTDALQMPAITPLDAALQMLVATIYIAVGVAGLAHAPRDERTRVFLGVALANGVGGFVPTLAWWVGVTDPLAFDRVPLGLMLAALSAGALLLFHFSQVFPRRRPWIRGSGVQMPAAYMLAPVVVFLIVRWWPADPSQATPGFGLMLLVFGFPLMVLLALVLPIATFVSFLRSLREAPKTTEPPDARPPVAGILMSQIGAAVLGLLVAAPLEAAAPESWAAAFVTLTVTLLVLLTPAAYAAGIWKYRVLEIPLDGSAEVQPD